MKKTIRMHASSGAVVDWEDNDEVKYEWQIGMSGELIIYYKTVHKVISNAEIDAGIKTVFASGKWERIDVLQE